MCCDDDMRTQPPGYIFTCGFKSRTLFRSSVDLGALCVHECEIIGKGGVSGDKEQGTGGMQSCDWCWVCKGWMCSVLCAMVDF